MATSFSAPKFSAPNKAIRYLLLAFVFLISFYTILPLVSAQDPLQQLNQEEQKAYESCEQACGTNQTCLQACKGGAGAGFQLLEFHMDPVGTIGELFEGSGTGGVTPSSSTFTKFTGGLETPDPEGYDEALVQSTNARDYALQITNFVLGFLGLIAILIVIYGGFLYLTDAGKAEQAEKGKKAITYAIMGILIILGSYAIVNTVLRAPSGTDQGTLSGAAPTGTEGLTSAEQTQLRRSLFGVAGVNVRTIATDFLTSYQNFTQTRAAISSLDAVPEVKTSADFATLLQGKINTLNNIQATAQSIGEVNEVVPGYVATLTQYLQESAAALAQANGEENVWSSEYLPTAKAQFLGTQVKIIADLNTANQNDFAVKVVETKQRIAEIKLSLGKAAELQNVQEAFTKVENALDNIATGSLESSFFQLIPVANAATATLKNPNINNQEILAVITLMKELYDAVKEILFVNAVITADLTTGSAPLLVNFDALRSEDPNQQTLTDFTWDFGDENSGGDNIATGATATHTFEQPGTYVVKLTIKSPTPETTADGVATVRIIVRPPANKIFLRATTGEGQGADTFELRRYDTTTGTLLVDRNILKVSPSEAEAGITFDATETPKERIRSVRWNFGDQTPEIVQTGEGIELTQEHSYTKAGTYTMFVEVTDIQNNTDRKIVNIIVGSPLARIIATPGTIGKVNQSFTLNAGTSTSDSGEIVSWQWNISDKSNVTIEGPENSETLKLSFKRPGTYPIELEVTDSLGDIDNETIRITIESAPPRAQYRWSIPDPTQPGTVTFDGGLSYDPDGNNQLQYQWEVNGQTNGANFSFVDGTTATSAQPKIKFKQKGTYAVSLTVTDPHGFGPNKPQNSEPFEKDIIIDNVLDIAWGAQDKPSAMLTVNNQTNEATAPVNFTLLSENGIAYEVDFGDGETGRGEILGNSASIKHNYKAVGTYVVTAKVYDEEDNGNSVSRKIFIGSSDTPVAVAGVKVNNIDVVDTTGLIKVTRKDIVSFNASHSLNTDGTGRNLSYSWNFGNNQLSTQEKVNQTYRDLGTYEVALKVNNANNVSQISPNDKVKIEVVGEPPLLRSIVAVPTSTSLTTPVTVQVTAIGAEDKDGRITRYRWWYYDPANDSDQLGVQVTPGPTASLTIGTRGDEGQEKTYRFAVEITDDENNTISSRDLVDENRTASLTVTNGPNKAPTASFTVDRTSAMVGDTINFSSSSTDQDGTITAYYWDFEGDGFANNPENLGSNPSYTFTEAAKNGIPVRLKVKDNNESEATSDPILIYIDGKAADPVAGFTVTQQGFTKQITFTNTSTTDTAAGVIPTSWSWDFDMTVDSNGDGKKDNDLDSTQQSPVYEYPDYGIYRAKLTVKDSEGGTSSVVNFVNVKPAPGTNTTTTAPTGGTTPPSGSTGTTGTHVKPSAPELEARLLSTPAPSPGDGKIHLQGDKATVTFDYSTSVGPIVSYIIDKNIFFDTNGNGRKDDDEDMRASLGGKWTTDFDRTFGATRVRLTVIDSQGRKDIVEKDIVFDSTPTNSSPTNSLLKTSIFEITLSDLPAVGFTITGFSVLGMSLRRLRKETR